MPVGAIVGAGVVSAGASVAAGAKNAKAISKSADAQAQSNAETVALQREVYGQNKEALAPFMQRGDVAGNYLNAFLGLPGQSTAAALATSESPAYAGADSAAQVQYLLGVGDSKTGRAMQNYYNANQSAAPDELLATLRGMADTGERSKLDAYVAANPARAAVAGTPAVSMPGVTSQDAQNAFGSYLANSDYAYKSALGGQQVAGNYSGMGALQSGSALKALQDRQNNINQGYQGVWMSGLGNQQGVGSSSASALAGVGQGYANNITALNSANANALGASAVARANNGNAMIGGVTNAFGNSVGALYGGGFLGK